MKHERIQILVNVTITHGAPFYSRADAIQEAKENLLSVNSGQAQSTSARVVKKPAKR